MDIVGPAIIRILVEIIDIYWWVLIISAVLSWLVAFGVVNTYNRGVATIADVLYRLTEPVLRPIRSILPNLGGIDISPVIVLLILSFVRDLLIRSYRFIV